VECGDRFSEALGGQGLWIHLALTAHGRTARLEARGSRARSLLAELAAVIPESSGV
jgi:hypothetical protein